MNMRLRLKLKFRHVYIISSRNPPLLELQTQFTSGPGHHSTSATHEKPLWRPFYSHRDRHRVAENEFELPQEKAPEGVCSSCCHAQLQETEDYYIPRTSCSQWNAHNRECWLPATFSHNWVGWSVQRVVSEQGWSHASWVLRWSRRVVVTTCITQLASSFFGHYIPIYRRMSPIWRKWLERR